MASPVQQVAPTADVVGNAFVLQYYHILEQSPEHVYRFYQDNSKFGRPEDNGMMKTVTTMDIINRKIVENGKLRANVVTVDAQDSFNKGVFVLVTGFLIGKDNLRKKFTQSFFLAPQDKGGYYVLNDVFRYVDDSIHQNGDNGLVADAEAPLTPEHDPSALQDNHVSEPVTAVSEGVTKEEVYNPSENGEVLIEEEETPVPEVVDEIPDDSEVVAESGYSAPVVVVAESEKTALVVADAGQSAPVVAEAGHSAPVLAESVRLAPVVVGSNPKTEEGPKKSYASIVKVMKESALPFSTPAHASVRTVPKPQEQRVIAAPTSAPAETVISGTNAKEDGNQLEAEAEGHSIYIKGLPFNATPALIENEFKKFGPIKSGGVQVRTQKGFGFGFVEFEDASAVQSALEASPIMINGRPVVVEEKRSTSRGNRGRFSSGRGSGYRNEGSNGYRNEGPNGFRNDGPNGGYRNDGPNGGYRNDGPRGRGGYGGGRGYGRSDFNSKSEFGGRNTSRGGSSGRGGDGYQRSENGGRVNRAGGPAVNAAAKSAAPRVSASA